MGRIKSLNKYQKFLLVFMTGISFVSVFVYSMVVSRVGYNYRDKIFIPSVENGIVTYSAKLNGQPAVFTVEGNTVEFCYGEKKYGPYTVKEDQTAIPEGNENAESMTGIEIYDGENLMFRGGLLNSAAYRILYNENGSTESVGFISVTEDGTKIGPDGNIIDPVEPYLSTILDLTEGAKLTHKGDWLGWFGGVFVCLINVISILFAEELFRLDLAFRIRNVDNAQPSELEIASRYFGWTAVTIGALVIFIIGLQV